MSSMKYYFGFGMLGCAGIYAAVCAYKFYYSNKNVKAPCTNGKHVVPNEPVKVEVDGLFMFYVDNELYFIPEIKEDMEFSADKVLRIREDGTRLEVHIINLYEHYFADMKDSVSSLKYEGTRMYLADPKHEDHYYGCADDLHEIDLDLTAGEVIQMSKNCFHWRKSP